MQSNNRGGRHGWDETEKRMFRYSNANHALFISNNSGAIHIQMSIFSHHFWVTPQAMFMTHLHLFNIGSNLAGTLLLSGHCNMPKVFQKSRSTFAMECDGNWISMTDGSMTWCWWGCVGGGYRYSSQTFKRTPVNLATLARLNNRNEGLCCEPYYISPAKLQTFLFLFFPIHLIINYIL